MRRLRPFVAVLLAAAATAPATAPAATRVDTNGPTVRIYRWVNPGEQPNPNPLELTVTGTQAAVTVRSASGEAFEPLGVCTADVVTPPATSVTCTASGYYDRFLGMDSILTGGDDRFDASGLDGVSVQITAGAGNDTVTGGGAGDYLTGNAGDDELRGGPGNDYLDLVDDRTTPADPDTRVSDCGEGAADVVKRDLIDPPRSSFPGCEGELPEFPAGLTLPPAPTAGSVLSVGSLATEAPVRQEWRTCDSAGCGGILSTAATYMPTGADIGRTVEVGLASTATGGPDGRTYESRRQVRSGVVGSGPAVQPGVTDPPARDTSAPRVAVPKRARKLAVRKGVATFRLGRASEAVTGTLTLAAGGRTIGKAGFKAAAGRAVTVRVKLTKTARRRFKRTRTVRTRATLAVRDAAGNAARTRFEVALRAGGPGA